VKVTIPIVGRHMQFGQQKKSKIYNNSHIMKMSFILKTLFHVTMCKLVDLIWLSWKEGT